MEGASFYNLSCWESSISMDQDDPFDSALTSIVSSPVAPPPPSSSQLLEPPDSNNHSPMIRELIGRLGIICSSRDASVSFPGSGTGPNNAATACYSTLLDSPTKLAFSMMEQNSRSGGGGLGFPGSHLPLPADSGFMERAAGFSCFGGRNISSSFAGLLLQQVERADSGRFSRVSSSQNVAAGTRNVNSPENAETGDSPEASSISEQIPRPSEANPSRKRKFVARGKAKESAKDSEDCSDNEQQGKKKSKDDNVKPPEPPKDYIHVRARRGQATDSHSLAERVRREKISQRMKVLQDLVPGCNKVTGKAVMLDEIINYVQSLQRQVEFLSMKLATLNPRMEFNIEAVVSKETGNPHGSPLFLDDSSSAVFPYGYRPHQTMQLDSALGSSTGNQFILNALNVAVHPSMGGFCEASSTGVSGSWDDELCSIVQMGLLQHQPPQRLQGSVGAGQMKMES